MECSYIATHIVYTLIYAFTQVIPSPLVQILWPKIILYQIFQVFPDYKVPIQVLFLQPKSTLLVNSIDANLAH